MKLVFLTLFICYLIGISAQKNRYNLQLPLYNNRNKGSTTRKNDTLTTKQNTISTTRTNKLTTKRPNIILKPTKNNKLNKPTTQNDIPTQTTTKTLQNNISTQPTKIEIKIGVILPVDQRPFSIQKCLPAILYALESRRVRDLLSPDRVSFSIHSKNSKCNAIAAPLASFDLIDNFHIHVFFGPFCDYSLAPVAG